MTSTPRPFFAAAAATLSWLAVPALVQAQAAVPSLEPTVFSSSSSQNAFAGEDIDGRELASAPNGSLGGTTRAFASPQYGGGYGNGRYHPYSDNSRWSHLAFEVGGGFTAPVGNAASGGFSSIIGDGQKYGTITWGGNLFGGAGWSFSKNFSVLGEFQYDTNKIPGRTLSAFYNEIDSTVGLSASGIASIGGNVHTYSVTAEPIFYYYNSDKHSYAGYLIGGGGWYHKSTNFTAPVVSVDPYYGYEYVTNQTFTSDSSNSLGANLGTGVSFKPFGQYSHAKLFAEARFVFVDSPRESAADFAAARLHTGTEELIPVSVGIRF